MLHDAELADAVSPADLCVAERIGREEPLVVVSAVAFIDDAHMVGLDDTEVFVGAASRNHVGLIALWQLHGNAKRHQLKLTGLQLYIVCCPKVDPVGFAVNIG